MFERHHTIPWPRLRTADRGRAGDEADTLARACTALREAVSDLAAKRSLFEAEQFSSAPDTEVAAALDAVRAARGRCSDLAAVVQEIEPRSPREAGVKRDVLAAYSALVDLDDLGRGTLSDFILPAADAARPDVAPVPHRVSPLKAWLRLGAGTETNASDAGMPPSERGHQDA